MTKVSVSILGSDLANISQTITDLESAGADMIHLDVMDGVFVPNITFGQELVKCVKSHAKIPLDTHLMVEKPENHMEAFIKTGSDSITFHFEATTITKRIIQVLKKNNILPGLSIKPNTSVQDIAEFLPDLDRVLIMSVEPGFAGQSFIENSIHKIKTLRLLIDDQGLNTKIFVDGGVNEENSKKIITAGADVLVAASSVLKNKEYKRNIAALKNL